MHRPYHVSPFARSNNGLLPFAYYGGGGNGQGQDRGQDHDNADSLRYSADVAPFSSGTSGEDPLLSSAANTGSSDGDAAAPEATASSRIGKTALRTAHNRGAAPAGWRRGSPPRSPHRSSTPPGDSGEGTQNVHDAQSAVRREIDAFSALATFGQQEDARGRGGGGMYGSIDMQPPRGQHQHQYRLDQRQLNHQQSRYLQSQPMLQPRHPQGYSSYHADAFTDGLPARAPAPAASGTTSRGWVWISKISGLLGRFTSLAATASTDSSSGNTDSTSPLSSANNLQGQSRYAMMDDGDDIFDNVSDNTDDEDDNPSRSTNQEGIEYEEERWHWRTWHTIVYDPVNPEFSSTQQFTWACALGIFFGIFTAKWSEFIERCVELVWVDVPDKLLDWGVFTELDGRFPLPHYMWVCPAVFGGTFSMITVMLPTKIPDQNEWIETMHRVGVLRHDTFFSTVATATAGMASGLSLGPELPLILSSGMVGSLLALKTHQSVLSARVLNLTAGSAAIAGFFGFPMAGALFVLELPHQMGLQYFEALSPATIASIIAVLVNRMATGNEIKGYFNYPWLQAALPSHLFYIAIIYGLFGAGVGVIYAESVKGLKTWTHDWFHFNEDSYDISLNDEAVSSEEEKGLISGQTMKQRKSNALIFHKRFSFGIKHEPTRAAVIGVLAGALTGVICMFVPHNLFWGEAQLQTLIDKGKTPLPFLGGIDEPTAIMTSYGYCMVDPEDDYSKASGFGIGCAFTIMVTKTITIGLSIGTGIIGGHFWGPLFVGCAAGHFFTDLMIIIHGWLDEEWPRWAGIMGSQLDLAALTEPLGMYPCVAMLCIMGSAHVVTFRAHLAIMLILTLTINTFEGSGGDYSAVFPLLVVSCFISLMITRGHIFYKQQRCRGDIIASPEVLCEPFKEGMPEYPQHYANDSDSWYSSTFDDGTMSDESTSIQQRAVPSRTTADDIEREFIEFQQNAINERSPQSKRIDEILATPLDPSSRAARDPQRVQSSGYVNINIGDEDSQGQSERSRVISVAVDRTPQKGSHHRRTSSTGGHSRHSSITSGVISLHRRQQSMDRSVRSGSTRERADSTGSQSRSGTPTQAILQQVSSYGEISDFQPSIMNQARTRASSVTRISRPGPSGRHSRSGSNASASMIRQNMGAISVGEDAGGLSQDDLERSFNAMMQGPGSNQDQG